MPWMLLLLHEATEMSFPYVLCFNTRYIAPGTACSDSLTLLPTLLLITKEHVVKTLHLPHRLAVVRQLILLVIQVKQV